MTTQPISPEVVRDLPHHRMALLRSNAAARAVGLGWLRIDDTNVVGNCALLISAHNPIVVKFKHAAPYHDHMRAYALATEYASDHPEAAAGDLPKQAAMSTEYRGFKIYQRFRRVEKRNPISGHTWSEPEPISRYRIEAPEGFPPFLRPDDLRTESGARKHIDYLIKFRDYRPPHVPDEEVAEDEALSAPSC